MKVGISLPVRELQDDLGAVREFAQTADELGFTHLRVPDQVLRPGNGHLHEPMMLLSYVAAITSRIELVPSVIVAPARQTVLLAKQAAELSILTDGRTRLGVGVGGDESEYQSLAADFSTRGARLEEQIELLRRLWTEETVTFAGRWDTIDGAGLNPRPLRTVPIWIGPGAAAGERIRSRIGRLADGWFVLGPPEDYPAKAEIIDEAAEAAGRDPATIGAEASVAIVGAGNEAWRDLIEVWRAVGLTHLCLRTLGHGLSAAEQLAAMRAAATDIK